MDVLPTLVDLLGVAPPSVDGRSLLPAIRGEPWPSRPVYFEALDANLTRNWAPLTGVVLDGWKYIDLPDAELYDLAADPGEQRNVFRDHADRAAAMTRQLADLRRRPSDPSRPAPIDADAAARLRSLGYASGGRAAPNDAPHTSADDPKRLLDLDRRYEEALKRTGAGDFAQAQALLEGVIATRPDFAVAYLNLASVFLASGQPGRAVDAARGSGIAGYLDAGTAGPARFCLPGCRRRGARGRGARTDRASRSPRRARSDEHPRRCAHRAAYVSIALGSFSRRFWNARRGRRRRGAISASWS